MHVAMADHVVMVITQFVERAWLRPSKCLEYLPDFGPPMAGTERGVLLSLPSEDVDRVQRVSGSQFVLWTRYFLRCVLVATLCKVSFCWSRSHVVGWYS